MLKTVTDIKPHYADGITDTLRSVAYSAGRGVHPEFIRAIYCVALSFGISENELRQGTTRTGRLYFKEDVTANLQSVLKAAGNVHPEFTRALVAIAMQFNISEKELGL